MNHLIDAKYHHREAGYFMSAKIPIVEQDSLLISDVEQFVIKNIKNFDSIDFIYVIDSAKHLLGCIPIKELFVADKRLPIKSILVMPAISVRPHSAAKRVAYSALKHDMTEIPVVDKENHFWGAIIASRLIKILDTRAVEDIFRFGGLTHGGVFDDILHIPFVTAIKHRLPWLLVGLAGGMLAALLTDSFEAVLSKNIILVSFIPLMVYMADAVGTQTEAFIIRDLSMNPELRFYKYFLKHWSVVSAIGMAVSLVLLVLTFIFIQSWSLSFVLALSLFLAIQSSLLTGLLIPYLFEKMKFDPANASGPVATMIQDIMSIFLYFVIASWIL
ncbi:MAG: magnesium transporter [Parcubacteria group bacterium]|nr:magnesium transporter [Parcubacteria group bacterium]